MELARLLIAAIADSGLGNAPATVRAFGALESNGLLLGDWLESLIAGRVSADGILSIAIQIEPSPAASVVTGSTRLQFGTPAANVASGTVVTGEALRNIVGDFRDGVG
jgi:hypothetical protein